MKSKEMFHILFPKCMYINADWDVLERLFTKITTTGFSC